MIAQAWIALFGVAAIWLSQHSNAQLHRWACICGLLAQPAWFYTTFTHQQWGIFALSFIYAAAWVRGVRTYWWRAQA